MSDLKVAQPTAVEAAQQPAPAQKRLHRRTASVTSLALACAFTYLAFGSLSPGRSSFVPDYDISWAGSAAASADASPLADAPHLSWSPPSASSATPWTDAGCRSLPNLSGGRFLSTVCCASNKDAADDATRATLWLVRSDELEPAEEDFRVKGLGLLKAERAERRSGRPVGQSKLVRPLATNEGKSACSTFPLQETPDADSFLSSGYRFDFAIPEPTSADNADYVSPSINVFFQTAKPIVSPQAERTTAVVAPRLTPHALTADLDRLGHAKALRPAVRRPGRLGLAHVPFEPSGAPPFGPATLDAHHAPLSAAQPFVLFFLGPCLLVLYCCFPVCAPDCVISTFLLSKPAGAPETRSHVHLDRSAQRSLWLEHD